MYSDDEDADDFVEDSPDNPDESDTDSDHGNDFAETVSCPYCDQPIYEQAEQCPNCGKYISREHSPSRKPMWFILTAVVCLIVILMWWMRRGIGSK